MSKVEHQHKYKVVDIKDKKGRIGQIVKFACGCHGEHKILDKDYGK